MSNLPKYHPSHQQEAESLKRLAGLLPPARFILRKEDGGDFGVDRVLEVVECGEATNVRSHIQVKSKEVNQRRDGTIKTKVPVRSLVYLLRNANSLILVYSLSEDQFYWAWVRDIALEASSKGLEIEETKQKSFTYRFRNSLSPEALDEIHEKLLRDNELVRKLDFDRYPLLRSLLGGSCPHPFDELSLLYLEGRYEAVVGLASTSDLEEPFARNIVAHSYYQIRNLQEALRVITQGNKTSPADSEGRRTLAIILCEMGRDRRDRALLTRAREIQESIPRDKWTWEDHYNLGNMLDLLGQHKDALTQYDAAVGLEPNVAMIWKNMAGACFQLGDRVKETEYLDKALQLNPDLVEALVSKATTIGMTNGEPEKAVPLLQRAIRLSTKPHFDNSDFHWWLARFLANADRVFDSLRAIDEALGLYPTSPRLQELRASIVIQNWRKGERIADEAVYILEDLISRSPKLFPACAVLIEIYTARGQGDRAKSILMATLREVGLNYAEDWLTGLDPGEVLPFTRNLGAYLKYRASSDALAANFFEHLEVDIATFERIELVFATHFARLASIVLPDRPVAELLTDVEYWAVGFRETNKVCSSIIAETVTDNSVEVQSDLLARLVLILPELTLRELARQLGWLLTTNGYDAQAKDSLLKIETIGNWLGESIESVLDGAHVALRWTET